MIQRRLQAQIETALNQNPGVVLLGPRQVGKTTLAKLIAAARVADALYLDLERPSDQRRLADAETFLRAQAGKLVVVDEIHRAPALFGVLRGIIDEYRGRGMRHGHFLILGSAALELIQQASETLAGRVLYLDLGTVDAGEWATAQGDFNQLWVRGGFPDSLLAGSEARSLDWRRAFTRSYLERDIPLFAPRLPAETVGRLWTMLAHAQGAPLNASRLAASLAVSTPTAHRYVDLLVDLLLLRRLRPWSGNVGKRLVRTPKVYLRDSGLTHALLDIENLHALLGHPIAGASWEGFVIESLIAVAGNHRQPYFYRTEDGAEIDLVLERGGEVEFAIEIKRSSAPTLSRGSHTALATLRPKHAFLVHSGDERWPMENGVIALPLPQMLRELVEPG